MAKLPEKAPDSKKCSSLMGGPNHIPRGAEMLIDGVSVKFEKCTKCGLRVGDRKS